jgi:hypothetical protein
LTGRPACAEEVKRIVTGGDLPSLDSCARVIARPTQTGVLREDLASLAEAVRTEGSDRAEKGSKWSAAFDTAAGAGKIKPLAAVLSAFRGYALTMWAMVALLVPEVLVGLTS